MDEITAELIEIDTTGELIDEIMDKYGQEILQLAFSYVKKKK